MWAHHMSPSLGLLVGHAITLDQAKKPDVWDPELKEVIQIDLYSLETRKHCNQKKERFLQVGGVGKEPGHSRS